MRQGSPLAAGLDALDHVAGEGAPQPVPVTVLTGFLGAGKTTLLNRIVAIGTRGATDEARTKTLFDACIAN